jgi:hypothetical protein
LYLSSKTTHIVAQRESLGLIRRKRSLAEGEQYLKPSMFDAFSVGMFSAILPSDSRWALMSVIFDD